MHRAGNLWWGLLLIAFGVMFLLDNMNMLDFGEVVRTYWPAILILWGVGILLNRARVSTAPSGSGTVDASTTAGEVKEVFNDRNDNTVTEQVAYSSVFGDLSLRLLSPNFRGGTVSTVFGDTLIDLSSATLADGENRLKLSGVFGDVRILLAPSMAYAISATSLFGAIQAAGQKRDGFSSRLSLQSPEYASAPKKVLIDVSQVFGDITLTR
jgi:lia operon protein LiaF